MSSQLLSVSAAFHILVPHTLKMDPELKKLFIFFLFQLSLYITVDCMARDAEAIMLWYLQKMWYITFAMHGFRVMNGRGQRRLWAHERGLFLPGFFDQNLLGSFNAREFKGRMRMDLSTFENLCSTLAPDLQRQDTRLRMAIPVQVKVAVAISRLATGNSMQAIADLYRIGLSSSQDAVSQFCIAMKTHLLQTFIKWPTPVIMEKYARDFQDIHQIPYVVGAIDGSHIPIVAPRLHAVDYYNRKGFHSILLQGVVSSKCHFWDYDIGWAGSMHDANLWGRTDIGQYCEAGKLSPYALVGDAAYPCRPWMFAPFKGHKDGLSREEYHWNYVQSSTRMCVERAFGMLKLRWRILLKRIDVALKNVPDLVTTCLILHNMCLIFGDNICKQEWMREATDEVHNGLSNARAGSSGGARAQERLAVANLALQSLAGVDESSRETLEYLKQEAATHFEIAMSTSGKSFKELSARRNSIARSLWMAKTKANIAETFISDSV